MIFAQTIAVLLAAMLLAVMVETVKRGIVSPPVLITLAMLLTFILIT